MAMNFEQRVAGAVAKRRGWIKGQTGPGKKKGSTKGTTGRGRGKANHSEWTSGEMAPPWELKNQERRELRKTRDERAASQRQCAMCNGVAICNMAYGE
jgi:hypothetical protein